MTIFGLTGSQTADTATLAVNSTSNCFGQAGVWTKSSGKLVLTASGIVSAGEPVVVAFSLINPAAQQTSPSVMVEAELKDGLGASFGSIFPLEMKKPGAGSRALLQNLARSCGVDGTQACVVAQSSVAHGGVASRAVDNNIDTSWGGGSVTHTNEESGPWWMVDFGRQVKISGLRVYNRGDCCQEHLQGFSVYIGNSTLGTVGSNAACATYQNAPMVSPFWKDIGCLMPLTGRYLYIHSSTRLLFLAEVQVYGEGFRTPDLHGVANGAHPLEVLVPAFSVKYIEQSSPVAGANNTMTVTLTANYNLGSGSTVTITGLTGSQTTSTSSLSATSTRSLLGTTGNWSQNTGQLVLTAGSHVETSKTSVVLTFTLINPAMSQTSPPVRVGAVIIQGGSVLGSINAELMTSRTGGYAQTQLYGVVEGYKPLQVLRPAFTLKSIEQSSLFPGDANTITVSLRTNYRLASGSTVTIAGLTGSQTASSLSFPITSTYNQFGTTGEWEKESGTLKLTVSAQGSWSHCGQLVWRCGGFGTEGGCRGFDGNSACDGYQCRVPAACVQSVIIENDIYTLTFDLINPQASQPSPEVRVLAEIKHAGTIVSNVEQSPMAKQDSSTRWAGDETHQQRQELKDANIQSLRAEDKEVRGSNSVEATADRINSFLQQVVLRAEQRKVTLKNNTHTHTLTHTHTHSHTLTHTHTHTLSLTHMTYLFFVQNKYVCMHIHVYTNKHVYTYTCIHNVSYRVL